jgi:dienelactone hydrolase
MIRPRIHGEVALCRNRLGHRAASTAIVLLAQIACGGNSSPTAPTPPTVDLLAGFTLSGDPTAAAGGTWTYQAQASGVNYDLQGILLKPQGSGSFPAVVVSHGAGGNATGYSRAIARVMVGWGLVCIATNYTHAGGVPVGSPGSSNEPGASVANVQRARRLVDILRGIGYVDMNRLALHGHSMGAFVTAATAGAHPDLFRAASHSAGGVRPGGLFAAAPTETQVAGIRAPYQMHHGDRDFVVPLLSDQLFAAVLSARGVEHELIVYPGADHDDVSLNPAVLERIRAWYESKGVLR